MTRPRLLVTGTGPDGRSTVLSDHEPEPVRVRALPGQELYLLWGSPDGGVTVGRANPEPVVLPFFAGPGGSRLLLVRFPPEGAVTTPPGDRTELAAETAARLPGLMDAFVDGDTPGMHTTDTLDYGMCLEGELWLELGDTTQVRLTPGTCVVQQGTRHAWHNRSAAPALMCFVGIGARRAE